MLTRDAVVEALKTINDPEILLDIWTLGLIYDITIKEKAVDIRMTFTSLGCPAGPYLVGEVEEKIKRLEGVEKVNIEVVFDPPWEPSEELKALLGIA